jgi:hypothetical protein
VQTLKSLRAPSVLPCAALSASWATEFGRGDMTGCQAHKNPGSFRGLLDLRDRKLTEGRCVAASWRPWLRSFDHCSNRLRVEWLPVLVAVAGIFQPGADFPIVEAGRLCLSPSGGDGLPRVMPGPESDSYEGPPDALCYLQSVRRTHV